MEAYVTRKDLQDGITEIAFFHPQHNALPSGMLSELAETIDACGKDNLVEVIVLKSGGDRTFCAGASFDELVQIDNLETGTAFFSGFANVINACRKCPKLIIGRVQGKVVGGGVGLAAAADYCLATEHASIRLSEITIGIGPFVIGPAVERKIGLAAFSQLSINATEFQSAQWAKEKGLYAEIHADVQQLDQAVMKIASSLAATSPEARTALKRVFWDGCENWDALLAERAAMSGRLVLSDFTKKALARYR
ncbi:MAG: enoyl-CoA hydratase/isomerase family protein [Marinoscillum sp.]|uniref:enoyl-CoA hydratase/isomerase family protein n=1 Tax=Marinoscillum sp. TaxID=2024838 RepID=UPI0032F0A6EF